MRRRHPATRERGAAAVEFAIVLPVLVALLCGTIDWGYYFFTREIVVNASREGARVGTLQFGTGLDYRTEAETAARTYLTNAALNPAAATITTAPCPANASCVRISYTTGGSITGFLGTFVPNTINAYAQMRR